MRWPTCASIFLGGNGDVAIGSVGGHLTISSSDSASNVSVGRVDGFAQVKLDGGSLTIKEGHLDTLQVELHNESQLHFEGYADHIEANVAPGAELSVGGAGEVNGPWPEEEPIGHVLVDGISSPPS